MSSESIFDNLRALENDQLTFPNLEYNTVGNYLIVNAISSLSFKEIDAKIKLALTDFQLTLIDKKADAQHILICDGPELVDVEYNGAVDYQIEYQMKARDPYVPAEYSSNHILTENMVIAEIHPTPAEQLLDKINSTSVPENATVLSKGSYYVPQEQIDKLDKILANCPDCKDGFYYPLFGPPEPCQTCKKPLPKYKQEVDQFRNDFQNHLLVKLQNIDLNSITILSDTIPNDRWYINDTIGHDSLFEIASNTSAEAFATMFYGRIKSEIIRLVGNQSYVRLNFTDSSIILGYDGLRQAHIMQIVFNMERK